MSLELIDAVVIVTITFGALFVISNTFKKVKTTSNKAKEGNLAELEKIIKLNTQATEETLKRKDKELNAYRQKNFQMEKKLSEVLDLEDNEINEDEEEEQEYPPLTIQTMNWNVAAKLAQQFGFNAEGLKNPILQNVIVEQLNKNEQYRRVYEGYVANQPSEESQDITSSIPPQNWV